ncbi:NAD(P)-binding domain-containing protein [Streptomyces sp. CA-146814]|uniref:NAD(P)-binding domain-containing protein n=1 Tax=Streptomyces sp. CA-146814 TaxID=3240053 RepID=UPI003D8C5071
MTVIGLGSMGRALAEAYVRAGHPTTVWNRTASKAAPLVALGARQARTADEAVAASGLVIACLTTFASTAEALGPAAATTGGRTLVTLNSGSPAEARAMAEWASAHGARYLGGAVKNVPSAVGAEDTLLYYGGDRRVFAEEIDRRDYGDTASSVDLFLAGAAHDEAFAEEAGLDVAWHLPFHDLLRRAVDAGHGGHSISALTEVLRSPA